MSLIKKRSQISKYSKLDNFDLLLKEQLMEQDKGIAHLRIRSDLFVINYDEIEVVSEKGLIGSGGSDALVFRARFRNNIVAFKVFKTKRICSSQDSFDLFEKEVDVMSKIMNHPNIVRFFGATLKPPRVGIVMEFCENGEILDFIQSYPESQGTKYPIKERIRMCSEIVGAMMFVHSKNVIHRDLKPQNILLDSLERCKLADFGLSRVVQESDDALLKTKGLGTSLFIAPEILCEKENPYSGLLKTSSMVEHKVAQDPNFRPDLNDLQNSLVSDGEKKYDWIIEITEKCWSHNPQVRIPFDQLWDIFDEFIKKEDDN